MKIDAMQFAIVASFPLDTYRGHLGAGEADPFPAPSRLHAALLAAAGQGPRAAVDSATGMLNPSPRDLAALHWLETNPPDGVRVPPMCAAARAYLRYRDTGTNPFEGAKASGGRWQDKVTADRPESSFAAGGDIAWTWSEAPPAEVSTVLAEIAADVSHVGTAESPVRLRVAESEPTHVLDGEADLWDPGGLDLGVATTGRTAALVEAHRLFMSARVKASPHSPSDAVIRPPREDRHTAVARYMPADATGSGQGPWAVAVLLPLQHRERHDDRVQVAVAVHRALVALIGEGAPPLVTGHFGDGVQRPANRLAIQVLDRSLPSRYLASAPSTIALLLPAGSDSADLAALRSAVDLLTTFRGPGGWRRRIEGPVVSVDASTFWNEPPPGGRLWTTVVPAVSDYRPPRERTWSLDDAIVLSVALAFRERLGGPGRGPRWMAMLAEAARAAGVVVHSARRLRRNDVARFVHRVHPHAVIAPYVAEVELGALGTGRDLVAIGQTRHLGGGLLVPLDGLHS